MEFIHQLGGLSYLGVFGISLLANAILPFPEEITLLSLGYLAGIGVFHFGFLIPICILGLLISDTVLYKLSYHGSSFTTKLYEKLFASRFDFLNNLSGERLERVILISRFMVYFRFLAPFLSGYYKLSFKRFLSYEISALSVYVSLYILIGFFLRNQLERVILGIGVVQNIIIAILILAIVFVVFRSLKRYFMTSITNK